MQRLASDLKPDLRHRISRGWFWTYFWSAPFFKWVETTWSYMGPEPLEIGFSGFPRLPLWHLQIFWCDLMMFDGHVLPNDWKPLLNMKFPPAHSKIMRLLLGGTNFLSQIQPDECLWLWENTGCWVAWLFLHVQLPRSLPQTRVWKNSHRFFWVGIAW